MELMMERTKQAATLEGQMNGYWKDRSESYSAQNLGQFFGEKRAAWEEKLFGDWTQGRSLRVLDIGTGPGLFAILAALRGHKVTAVDMSQEMLQKAQANACMTGVSIQLQQVGNRLPFAQESFDLIVSRDVTWTLTEPEEQLQHWASLLAPGGEMLYFDAEWYAYLRTEAHRKEYERKKREIREKGGFLYQKANDMEQVAYHLPLTHQVRPQWDREYWARQNGFDCWVEEALNEVVYSPVEQMQYESFPEFLVHVRRRK